MGLPSPDFRAPPPSPVASTRRATFTANDDILSEFLDKCGRVPNLVLPDKVFPKHRFLPTPPTFDFLRLSSISHLLLDAITNIGCFQLINHGVPEPMVRAAINKTISHGDELVLQRDAAAYYSDLKELMDEAERIGRVLREKLGGGEKSQDECEEEEEEEGVGACYVKKHTRKNESEEAIRMLIRGYDERHSLCLNFCHADAEFHVYSKRGWFSFIPRPDAVVVTVGDQGWSGRFKSVVGRPLLYHGSPHHHFISVSFLYTTYLHNKTSKGVLSHETKKKTISLSHQLLFALFLTLVLPFFLP